MPNKITLFLLIAMGSEVFAEDISFACKSEETGQEIHIIQNSDLSEARLVVQGREGEASVAHGLDGVTFIHIKSNEVWTMALHFPTMKYELSTHGAQAVEDHGLCTKNK